MSKKIKLSSITPDDKNNNKHTAYGMDLLEKSVNKVGIIESITVSNDDKIISGNARHEIFGKNFTKEALVIETDGTQPIIIKRTDIESDTKQFYEASILANTTAKKNIDFDIEVIDALAVEYDIDVLDLGVDIIDEEHLEAEEDDFNGVPPKEPITVLGDLYEIGEHRLLCGDSTDSDQVAKLMNGEKADIAFTSPPYNAGTTPTEVKMGKKSKYINDNDNKDESEYLNLLTDFTHNTLLFSDYSFVNIQSLSGNKTALIDFLYNMKLFYADTIIWQKQNAQPAMAENVLNSQFEYIHIFSHKANRAIGVKKFRGTLSNVLEISKQTKNKVKEHNATFPIDLANHFVSNFSEKSVIDLFLGSGSTMVASHQLKRKCYGMELDCKYCDVIVARMIKLDSTLPIKRNGVLLTNSEVLKFTENTSESN